MVKRTQALQKSKQRVPADRHSRHRFYLALNLLGVFLALLLSLAIDSENEVARATALAALHTADLSEATMLADMNILVRSIFDEHAELWKGIRQVSVSKEDLSTYVTESCKGSILGAHFNDTILLTYGDNVTTEFVLRHELGHNVWKQIMTDEEKEQWKKLFIEEKNFVTTYAAASPSENFAESFACYFVEYSGCVKELSAAQRNLLESVIHR